MNYRLSLKSRHVTAARSSIAPTATDGNGGIGASPSSAPVRRASGWRSRSRTGVPTCFSARTASRIERRSSGRLRRNGIDIRSERIDRLEHDQGWLSSISFDGGEPARCDALFFATAQRPQCDLAFRLGCAFNSRGTVTTGSLSNTNVPGVFVAGDASRDAQFVVVAAAEGIKAAVAINQQLQKAEALS